MKLFSEIMIAALACAGFAQVLSAASSGYPRKQKVRAYKDSSADKNTLWTMYIQEMNPGPAGFKQKTHSIVVFKENTDNILSKKQRVQGYPPYFLFKNENDTNTIMVVKKSMHDPDYNIDLSPRLLPLVVSPKDVPVGSQIRLSDSSIEIDTSKVKESISITNNFKQDIRIEVYFSAKKYEVGSKPVKKTISLGKKIVVKKPQGMNYIEISLYDGIQQIGKGSFDINDPRFDKKRDIIIKQNYDKPNETILYLNNVVLS